MSYWFKEPELLRRALTAGDSNSDDREGHRGMAQLGDSLMGTVILSDGLERGLSRGKFPCRSIDGTDRKVHRGAARSFLSDTQQEILRQDR